MGDDSDLAIANANAVVDDSSSSSAATTTIAGVEVIVGLAGSRDGSGGEVLLDEDEDKDKDEEEEEEEEEEEGKDVWGGRIRTARKSRPRAADQDKPEVARIVVASSCGSTNVMYSSTNMILVRSGSVQLR